MSNVPPLIDISSYINTQIVNYEPPPLIDMSSYIKTQIVDDEPPPLTYMYEYETYIMIGVNMFKCKNEIHVVKPLLKLLHDNNAIPRDNYNGINDGLQGFDTDLNEENKFYNNLVKNV